MASSNHRKVKVNIGTPNGRSDNLKLQFKYDTILARFSDGTTNLQQHR